MKKPNLQRLAQRSKIYLRKASPTILSGLGAAGVIVTSVLAVRATPKALRKIRADIETTTEEIVKAASNGGMKKATRKYKSAEECQKMYGYIPEDNKKKGGKWTATGTQFQIPYVFKKLFSREEIAFEDMCETKSVSSSLYLDLNEGLPDVSINFFIFTP